LKFTLSKTLIFFPVRLSYSLLLIRERSITEINWPAFLKANRPQWPLTAVLLLNPNWITRRVSYRKKRQSEQEE
jgi:hypothetical protein